jgi:cellulose synthase/poly-beta-1,6-N-acetylglucosamine synthase-like glycosyltransferase
VSAVIAILLVISIGIFAFFVIYTLATLSLTAYSVFEEVLQKIERGERFRPLRRPLRSGISLVVPAYNEELVIVPAARSLLGVDYAPLEVFVVDDGSADRTLAVLRDAFDLRELPLGDRFGLETEPLEALYVSALDPRLHVARKRNGGRSDAINAGINLARHELVGIVDADSLLDRDALARIVEVFSARIEFAADATCWTEAPPGLGPLRGQRVRWHIGLLDNLRLHHRMIGRRRFGAVGLLSLPYTILVEVCGPILQVIGYVIVIVLAAFDRIAWEYAIGLLLIVLLVAQLQTAAAILTEDIGFRRYRRRDLLLIGGWGLLEMFWYQPLSALWRVWASFLWLIGPRPGWGTIPRGAALAERPMAEAPELAPAPLSR